MPIMQRWAKRRNRRITVRLYSGSDSEQFTEAVFGSGHRAVKYDF